MTARPDNAGREQALAILPSDFPGQPIWTLEKRGGVIVASAREFKGTPFFELRLWAQGGAVPTKQGVTLAPGEVGSLALALTAYAERLERDKGPV